MIFEKVVICKRLLPEETGYTVRLGSDGTGYNTPLTVYRGQKLIVTTSGDGEVRALVEDTEPPIREVVLETALRSIANNSCCSCCQEAKNVAKTALGLK